MRVQAIPAASGATSLHRSASGKYTVAELRGQWLEQEFAEYRDQVPGIVKLLDDQHNLVVAAQGWALGAPGDDGTLLYVEEAPHEYAYQVRSTAANSKPLPLTPPDGFWHVKAALGAPGSSHVAIVLWSPAPGHDWHSRRERHERLWIASVDRNSLAVAATRTIDVTTPARNGFVRHGHGVTASRSALAIVEVPEPGDGAAEWHVSQLDLVTLKTRWRTRLPPLSTAAPAPEPTRKKRVAPVIAAIDATTERASYSAEIAFSGDGSRLAVAYGRDGVVAVSTDAYYVLSAGDGRVVMVLQDAAIPVYSAFSMTPIPSSSAIAILHVVKIKSGPNRGISFLGLSTLDLARGHSETAVTPALLAKTWTNGQYLTPRAAMVAGGEVSLAPQSFEWVTHSGLGGNWPGGDDGGARAPEVAQWVTMPREWHRPDREQVAKHDAWMEAIRAGNP